MCDTLNILYNPWIVSLWEGKHTLCEGQNAKHSKRNCQYISVVMPLSFRGKAKYATRGGPSSSENMPFLHVEDALLGARRACSQMLNITHWFLVGYILGCRQWYMRVLRVVSLVDCKDFLSFCCASPLTVFTPTIAVTLCELCMPEAFCGLEMCAKNLRELCALCERKIYPLWEKLYPL